jgi:UDP-N-acetylmuramoyl-L-alanyl-D-glutamate--2,6-diaminopimelate ligase
MKKLRNTNFSSIHLDSRTVVPDSLFVAMPGTVTDGSRFIDEAIQKGAKIIVHEAELQNKKSGIVYIRVTDSHVALARLAQAFFDYPSKKLKLVGVTGTNGKTTTATLYSKSFVRSVITLHSFQQLKIR